MSKFRERAREIRAKGVAERGNFTMRGVPLKIWNYWYSKTDKVIDRENFCHYWRVVFFWAPLYFLADKILDFLDTLAGKILVTLAVIGLVVWGATASVDFMILLLVMLGVTVFVTLIFGLAHLAEKNLSPKTRRRLGTTIAWILLAAVAAVLLLLLYLAWLDFGIIAFAWIFGVLAFVVALGFGMAYLADLLVGRRAVNIDRDHEELMAYVNEHGHMPEAEPREPGRVSKFFSGIGDFVVLIAQVVRVKKWKICPMAEVPKES